MLRHMILLIKKKNVKTYDSKGRRRAHYFVWEVNLLEICLVLEKIIGNRYE